MKFQLLINDKMVKNIDVLCFELSNVVIILLINVRMTTIVSILTLINRLNVIPSNKC